MWSWATATKADGDWEEEQFEWKLHTTKFGAIVANVAYSENRKQKLCERNGFFASEKLELCERIWIPRTITPHEGRRLNGVHVHARMCESACTVHMNTIERELVSDALIIHEWFEIIDQRRINYMNYLSIEHQWMEDTLYANIIMMDFARHASAAHTITARPLRPRPDAMRFVHKCHFGIDWMCEWMFDEARSHAFRPSIKLSLIRLIKCDCSVQFEHCTGTQWRKGRTNETHKSPLKPKERKTHGKSHTFPHVD